MKNQIAKNVITFQWGYATSIMLTAIFIGIVSLLVSNETIPVDKITQYSFTAQTISCLVGALVAGKLSRNRRIIQILICAASYIATLMFVGIVIVDGGLQNLGSILLSATIAVILACAFCIRKSHSKRIRKRTIRT